jgi:tight adherence protein B
MPDHLVFVFTTGAALCLLGGGALVLARAWERYHEAYLERSAADLAAMFLFVDARQLLVLTGVVTALGAGLGILFGPLVAISLVTAGLATPTLLVRLHRARRVRLFDRQLALALGSLSAALRSGLSLHQALEELARSGHPPLAQELALTVREIRLGTPTERALETLATRVGSEELELVVTSINTVRGLGGNLAELFDTLAATLRERFRVEGRIRALTAQGKLQGWIVGALPVLVWLCFDSIRPDLTRPMMHHWFGGAVVGLVAVMELLGAVVIRRIVAIRI